MPWRIPTSKTSGAYLESGYLNALISTPLRWLGEDAPVAAITSASSQTINDGGFTTLAFDTAIYDTGEMFDLDNSNRLTVTQPGLYWVRAGAKISGDSGAGVRALKLRIDGVQDICEVGLQAAPSGTATSIETSSLLNFNVEGYIEALLIQTSGQPLDTIPEAAGFAPSLQAVWLRGDSL